MESQTIKALDGLTDTGVFEKVAMAAIRLLPAYAAIAHPGINAEGKTQKSPVDGICFIDADRRHMVVAHHTTTAAKDLERKWLFDPSTVNRRPTTKTPLPEPGDFLKTLAVVKSERQRTADLNVTLILTTNREPDESLVRDVVSAGRHHDISVEVWSRSAIASILDTNAAGHHIRRKLLGIEEELVSWPLLAELSQQNVRQFDAQDNTSARVPRELDALLIEDQRPILFLVAPSGTGKTIACHKLLLSRIDEGGLAFIVPHQVVEVSTSLDQALMATLQQIKPSLASQQAPSRHFEPNRTATLLIEDINASSDPRRLIEKIAGWFPSGNYDGTNFPWRVICPVCGRKSIEAMRVWVWLSVLTPYSRSVGARPEDTSIPTLPVGGVQVRGGELGQSFGNPPLARAGGGAPSSSFRRLS